MVSLETAQKLKNAGLKWQPQLHDYFAIPNVQMDDKIFALSEMVVDLEVLFGESAITFNGTTEWALDHVFIEDVVWLPREDQLRMILTSRLYGEREPVVQLASTAEGYLCIIQHQGDELNFESAVASEAYAAALAHLLQES